MKRYDSSRMIRVVLTPEQKQWLQSQATGMQSMSDVVRRIIKHSMDLNADGLFLPADCSDQA